MVNLNIAHLVRVKDQPNVLTVQATTLQAQKYVLIGRFFVCLFDFTSHQQSFSYIGTGLPGLNQYQAKINVSCSRPNWEKEKKTVTKHYISRSSLQYELFYEVRSYASAVRPSTCNKATQTEDKTTQTDENITNSTKQTEAKSQEKPQEIKAEKAGKGKLIYQWEASS